MKPFLIVQKASSLKFRQVLVLELSFNIENSFVILVLSAETPLALLRGGTDTKM